MDEFNQEAADDTKITKVAAMANIAHHFLKGGGVFYYNDQLTKSGGFFAKKTLLPGTRSLIYNAYANAQTGGFLEEFSGGVMLEHLHNSFVELGINNPTEGNVIVLSQEDLKIVAQHGIPLSPDKNINAMLRDALGVVDEKNKSFTERL